MTKSQWEYNLVERHFCEQLRKMGWVWLEADVNMTEIAGRVRVPEAIMDGGNRV
ncbi:MAG: hypothetical protein WAP08_08640 [Smithellaceae bacterium]|jgi:hypothetical protein